MCRFLHIYRASLVDANAIRLLRKAGATAITKLDNDTDGKDGRRNRRRLLLSLKLRDFVIGEAAR